VLETGGLVVGAGFRGGDGVGEVKADDGFRGNLDLLAAGEPLAGSATSTAGSSAEWQHTAANLRDGVPAAAFASDGVGVG
jgi:hypothetical protein